MQPGRLPARRSFRMMSASLTTPRTCLSASTTGSARDAALPEDLGDLFDGGVRLDRQDFRGHDRLRRASQCISLSLLRSTPRRRARVHRCRRCGTSAGNPQRRSARRADAAAPPRGGGWRRRWGMVGGCLRAVRLLRTTYPGFSKLRRIHHRRRPGNRASSFCGREPLVPGRVDARGGWWWALRRGRGPGCARRLALHSERSWRARFPVRTVVACGHPPRMSSPPAKPPAAG